MRAVTWRINNLQHNTAFIENHDVQSTFDNMERFALVGVLVRPNIGALCVYYKHLVDSVFGALVSA